MVVKTAIFFILLYLSALAYLYLTQGSKIFNFSFAEKVKPKVLKECKKCKEIKLKVGGAVLDGVFKDENSSKIIIYFGGNADDATDFIKYCDDLRDFDIVAFNYRGNVLSSGKPTEKAIFKDSLKIYDTFAKGKEVYLIGRSLGSGVAVYLASKRNIKRLLLITPYDSIENVAKEKYPYFPISLLIKYKFNSLKYLKDVDTPTTVFMVKGDQTVPNKRTKNLIKHLKDLSNIIIFKNATHADIIEIKDFKEELKKWIKI